MTYFLPSKKIFEWGGGWVVDVGWYGKRQGRGLLLTTLYINIACILCRKKSYTCNAIYIFRRTLMRKKKYHLTQLVDATLHW